MTLLFEPEEAPTLAIQGRSERFPVNRVFCVGRNYAAHAREMGGDPEREAPFFFSKPATAVVGDNRPVRYPDQTNELHHEVELVVALHRGGQGLSEDEVADCVFGYGVGIDLTRRDLQAQAKQQGRPWDTAKGFDDSAPVSSLLPVAACAGVERGAISLRVNGELRQQGDLDQMIWRVPEVVAILSRYYRLRPGDLVFTGTPAGVGPLQRGDCLHAAVAGVAELEIQVL